MQYGVDPKTCEAIWKILCQHRYIVDKKFTKKCKQGIVLPPVMKQHEEAVNDIYKSSKDVKKGVLSTAVVSAAITGVIHSGGSVARLQATDGHAIKHLACKRIYF